MHICQDEIFTFIMAVQNGPMNIFRYLTALFTTWLAAGGWLDDDMRSWRQAREDMELLTKDRKRMVWVRAVRLEMDT